MRLLGGIFAVAGLWLAAAGSIMAQQPEEIPGLENLDSIPTGRGDRLVTCRTVFIDSTGLRSDSSVSRRSRYDRRGRLVETIGYDGSGEELYQERYLYDASSGRIARSLKSVAEYNEITYDWRYEYDRSGRIVHATDSVTGVVVRYSYGKPGGGEPCIATEVTGRYRFSGINSYCDASGRITRQVGYIGERDTVVALLEYPSIDRRRRVVYADGGERVRDWLYISDSQGHIVTEEYRAGTPGRTGIVYTIDNIFSNGLIQRRECRNYGSLDWIEYFEWRMEN
jgi:hypothetical protein